LAKTIRDRLNSARVQLEVKERLEAVLRLEGLTFNQWLRQAFDGSARCNFPGIITPRYSAIEGKTIPMARARLMVRQEGVTPAAANKEY